MPLPFILGAAAVAAAAYGAKKGYDGYQTKSEAESITNQSQEDYKQEKVIFDYENKLTNEDLNELGSLQLKIGSEFSSFRKISDALLAKLNQYIHHKDLTLSLPQHRLDKIKNLELSSITYLAQIAGAGATGGAAAFAVYGGVMSLAAASTGTSITALSGAAAYNATMAAIGGGSLAAGGFGMAGGTMVLGGVVTAPILAVAGWAYNAHAEKALDHAKETRAEVQKAITNMKLAVSRFQETRIYLHKITESIKDINVIFTHYLDELKNMDNFISNGGNINDVKDETILIIENGYKIAAILTDIICTPLFKLKKDNTGSVILDDNKAVRIETDENGFQILNTNEIDNNLNKAKEDVALFSL